MSYPAKVVDRSATKPIYLIIAIDETVKGKIAYYRTNDGMETNNYYEFRGVLLADKAQADLLTKNAKGSANPDGAQPVKTVDDIEVNRKLPWHRIIRIDNLSYKPKKEAQGE